jgi:hypothetical protein
MVLIFLQHSILDSLVHDDTKRRRLSALILASLSVYFIKMKWTILIHSFLNT